MAQVAHAVSSVSTPKDLKAYKKAKMRTVIVLEGSADQIQGLYTYLDERGIRADYVIDEGLNEVPAMSVTALATEPFDADHYEIYQIRKMLAGFKLYKHRIFGL